MIYTLMNAEHEVLDFEIDEEDKVLGISVRDGWKYAPIHFNIHVSEPDKLREDMLTFLRNRSFSTSRPDRHGVYAAVGVDSGIKLALRSFGLSLTDQYWYRPAGSWLKWKDINCFDNEFDDTFGRAILKRDYDMLAKADYMTPDCTLNGTTRKAWIRLEGQPMMLKSELTTASFTVQSELLASRLTERLLPEGDCVTYTRREFGGEPYIACRPMVKRGEELVTANSILGMMGYEERPALAEISKSDKILRELTDTLEGLGMENITAYYAKLTASTNLTCLGDCHARNFGFIRDVETMKLRAAPLYDRGRSYGSFGSEKNGCVSIAQHAVREPAGLFVRMLFNMPVIRPEWDFSWYDPKRLEGFEDDIERMIGVCDGIPVEYIKLLKVIFRYQFNYLNKAAGKA